MPDGAALIRPTFHMESRPDKAKKLRFADHHGTDLRVAEAGNFVETKLPGFTCDICDQILHVLRETSRSLSPAKLRHLLAPASVTNGAGRRVQDCRNHRS